MSAGATAMVYTRPLEELRAADAPVAGGKAALLGELAAAGFRVPPGFCLVTAAYEAAVAAPGVAGAQRALAALLADAAAPAEDVERAAAALRAAIEAAPIPPAVAAELEPAYLRLRAAAGGTGEVAVRSSGTAEDAAGASHAGQYTTVLGVRGAAELAAAVKRCWASLWLGRAAQYRARRGAAAAGEGGAAAMAIVVQAQLDPEVAGVLFTADPLTGARDRLAIEASWGGGEAIVSGLVEPDRFDVRKADLVVERAHIATKLRMTARTPAGPATVDVPRARRDAPSLTDAQLRAVAELGLAIEAHFQRPQDVEWAFAGGQLAVLQARPITTAPGAAPPPDVRWESPVPGARWARMSICDSWLPEPLSPLFATTLFPALIRGWVEGWAGVDPEHPEHRGDPLLPRPMSGTIHGYAYLRIDYPLNAHPIRAARLIATWIASYFGGLERRWREEVHPRHVARLGALGALGADELARLPSAEVRQRIAEAQELSGAYWGVIGGLAWYWKIGEAALAAAHGRLARGGADPEAALGPGALLQGYPTKALEAEVALYELARTAAEGPAAAAALARYLAAYGHQVYNLDLVEPTPAEDPSAVRETLAAYREGRAADPRQRLRALVERRELAETRALGALRGAPARRWLFGQILRWARRYAEVRDEVMFAFTLGWPFLRRAYLELGRRAAAAGVLEREGDVFFLTGPELDAAIAAIDAGAAPAPAHAEVAARRALREEQRRLTPPPQVPARTRVRLGPFDITRLALLDRQAPAGADRAGGLRGSAVSPGRATGPARTISSPRDFGRLRAGDVLIAPYITPAWTPLLAIAAAVVTDTGGTLSHGSIVAREYGIPAVMGTQRATRVIQDGQIVTVDGDRGIVY